MVVTEALARGMPVLATAVDGLPEAVGHTSDGPSRACWCRRRIPRPWPPGCGGGSPTPTSGGGCADCARERRTWLTGWDHTARQVATALSAAVANVAVGR